MGYRIRGIYDNGPGRNGRRRSPNPGHEISNQCDKHLGRIAPAGGGRQLSGGDSRSPLSQWTTFTRPGVLGALGMGDDMWRGQTEDRLEYQVVPSSGN